MGDGFYTSKDPTNSIKVLKEHYNCRNSSRALQKTLPRNGCVHVHFYTKSYV